MIQFSSLSAWDAPRRIALGIGVFDGVHRGHRKLLTELSVISDRTGAKPVALTFSPHPRAVLCPESAPLLLYSLEDRVRMLQEAGAAAVEILPFSRAFSQMPSEKFLEELVSNPAVTVTGFCVGAPWRFGKEGAGTADFVREFAKKTGRKFTAVEQLKLNGEIVSSSAIRRAIATGMLNKAELMLGRRYSLAGKVTFGHHAATERLECPTANLEIDSGILMPDGVYAAIAELPPAKHYPCAVNIGFGPTFGWKDRRRRIEAHLFDFSGSLYGEHMKLEFLSYLRNEKSFSSVEKLRAQIEHDIAVIRNLFNTQVNHG